MPASYLVLRVTLAAIGAGCAFMLGRSVAGLRRKSIKRRTVNSWALRTIACMGAVAFHYGADATSIVVWCVSAAAFASGFRHGARERKQEDLSHAMFPDGQ